MTRAYASPLRAEQAGRTRERILAALAEQLADASGDFSIARVARRAGVSPRTVYQHFPNREAQIEALAAWIERRAGVDEGVPASLAEVPAYSERMHRRFLAHEPLMRAQLAAGIAADVRARRRRARDAALDRCVDALSAPRAEARIASALLKQLCGADLGVALMDRHGLSGEEAARAACWLVALVVGALERGERPAGLAFAAARGRKKTGPGRPGPVSAA